MTIKYGSLVKKAQTRLVFVSAAVLCSLLLDASIGSAASTVIGQINPPELTPGGATGITFDGRRNPLVIDGFGQTIWRLALKDVSTISTFSLSTLEVSTRSLEFDVRTGKYFITRRPGTNADYLSTADPKSGVVTDIGVMGTFNFLDLAIDPLTGNLWLVNDCADLRCTSAGGGSLWTVDKSTGMATPIQTFGTSLGQLTAFAISSEGRFFVASPSSIYEIDPNTGRSSLITDTGLAPLNLFTDMAFDPSTNRLYAIEERRGVAPPAWYLDEVTGLGLRFSCLTGNLKLDENNDAFDLQATFNLGSGGSINPLTSAVRLTIGLYSVTISKGSFLADDEGYRFEGIIHDVHLEVFIKHRRRCDEAAEGNRHTKCQCTADSFEISAQGEGAGLKGAANPITVTISIGDNTGTTQINATSNLGSSRQ